MKIYLQRHAKAVPGSKWGEGDSSRPLADKGRKSLEKTLPELKRTHFSPACILSSPYQRAKETAETMVKSTALNQVRFFNELASGARSDAIREVIKLFAHEESLLIVGHMPDLALFAARLLGDPNYIEAGMAEGEIIAVETEGQDIPWGQGKLLWRRNLEDWRKVKE